MYSPAVIGIETSPPMLSSGPAWLFPTTTNRWLLLVAQSEDASGAREDGHGQAGLKNDLQHLAGHAPHDDAGPRRSRASRGRPSSTCQPQGRGCPSPYPLDRRPAPSALRAAWSSAFGTTRQLRSSRPSPCDFWSSASRGAGALIWTSLHSRLFFLRMATRQSQ